MNFGKLILSTFVATLGASFMHQASAQWLSGGSTTISRKANLSGLDLFCDLSRVTFNGDTITEDKRVKIVTLPSQASPNAQPSLTFNGEMFCAEVEPGTSGLENAVIRNGVTLVGRFKLEQKAPKITPQEGLEFSGPDGNGVRTWTFVVPPNPDFPFPELLYDLVPANQATANKFCDGTTTCKALLGLQLPAKQSDYPARDLDGTPPNDLDLGEVFKFRTTTNPQGFEAPGQFYWGPCHSGNFATYPTFQVLARQNASHQGTGVQTIVLTSNNNTRVAVTVNQNDLWNSGGQTGWSNADGRIRQMFSTGNDDSGATVNTLIGTVDSLSADNSHKLWSFVNEQWVSATAAAIGTLVGSTDGENFYIFNTAFDGPLPITGTLRLYYWDRQRNDNTQSVTVTVAGDSIQCGVTTVASSQVRGERRVEVEGFPVLNVTNTSDTAGFPFAVLGCNQGDATIAFGPDGSPIDLSSGQVLVNNQPVAIQSFSVTDTTSRPSCDGGQSLVDLNLKLNRLQFITAVVPPNCKNGPIAYSVALGSAANGWYGGQDTVDLQNCKKK